MIEDEPAPRYNSIILDLMKQELEVVKQSCGETSKEYLNRAEEIRLYRQKELGYCPDCGHDYCEC